MKFLIASILIITICLNASGQAKEIVERHIYSIKSVPSYFLKGFVYDSTVKRRDLVRDSSYSKIISLDTFALQYLIPFLSDTTLTEINNDCLQTKFKIADIAFFLIYDIEIIPFGLVTGGQYCTWGECGSLPDGFLYFLSTQRIRFKNDYIKYFYGNNRGRVLNILDRKSKKKRKLTRKAQHTTKVLAAMRADTVTSAANH